MGYIKKMTDKYKGYIITTSPVNTSDFVIRRDDDPEGKEIHLNVRCKKNVYEYINKLLKQ